MSHNHHLTKREQYPAETPIERYLDSIPDRLYPFTHTLYEEWMYLGPSTQLREALNALVPPALIGDTK